MAEFSNSIGICTLSDGSSWGSQDKTYPVGTWVTYTSSGGAYIGVYRDSSASSPYNYAWGVGTIKFINSQTSANYNCGVRVG